MDFEREWEGGSSKARLWIDAGRLDEMIMYVELVDEMEEALRSKVRSHVFLGGGEKISHGGAPFGDCRWNRYFVLNEMREKVNSLVEEKVSHRLSGHIHSSVIQIVRNFRGRSNIMPVSILPSCCRCVRAAWKDDDDITSDCLYM